MNTPIRIKTFRARTLQDAFEQIRKEFGPDASILETKAARKGFLGRSRLEVTASSNAGDFGCCYRWHVAVGAWRPLAKRRNRRLALGGKLRAGGLSYCDVQMWSIPGLERNAAD